MFVWQDLEGTVGLQWAELRERLVEREMQKQNLGRQEMLAHLGLPGDQCAWSMKEEESEEIKTRGRKLSQIGEVCE